MYNIYWTKTISNVSSNEDGFSNRPWYLTFWSIHGKIITNSRFLAKQLFVFVFPWTLQAFENSREFQRKFKENRGFKTSDFLTLTHWDLPNNSWIVMRYQIRTFLTFAITFWMYYERITQPLVHQVMKSKRGGQHENLIQTERG